MPNSSEPIPEDAVRLQLNRMLASRRFRIAHRQSQILRYVVEQTLAGETFNENIIGLAIYGSSYVVEDNHAVRVHASSLRRNIPEYYAKEGAGEPIVIRLPDPSPGHDEGESYTPQFAYAAVSSVDKDYLQGLQYLGSGKPELLTIARSVFTDVVRVQPTHIGGWVGLIEASCRLSFFLGHFVLPEKVILKNISLCREFLAIYPEDARAYLMMAQTRMTACDFPAAAIYFRESLIMNRTLVEESLWYGAFLLRIGRRDQALAVIQNVALKSKFDSLTQAVCGILYFLADELERFIEAFRWARELDLNCWLVRLLDCGFSYLRQDYETALLNYERISLMEMSGDRRAVFSGLGMLCALRSAETGTLSQDQIHQRKQKLDDEDRFAPERTDQIQMIFGRIAHHHIDDAAQHFVNAIAEREPVACWIPMLPFFAEMRPSTLYQTTAARIEADMNEALRLFEA